MKNYITSHQQHFRCVEIFMLKYNKLVAFMQFLFSELFNNYIWLVFFGQFWSSKQHVCSQS